MNRIKEIWKKIAAFPGKLPGVPVFRFLLNSDRWWVLVLKDLLMLAVCEVWVFLCGIVFELTKESDGWLVFTVITLLLLLIIAVTLIVWSIVRFVKAEKERI